MPLLARPVWPNVQPGSPMPKGVCAAATALWLRGISRAHASFGHSTNNAAREWAGGQPRAFCQGLQSYFECTNTVEAELLNIISGNAHAGQVPLGPVFHNSAAQYDPFQGTNLDIAVMTQPTLIASLNGFQAGHFGFVSAAHNGTDGHAMGVVCLRTRGSFSKLIGTHPGTVTFYFFDPNMGIYNANSAAAISGDMMDWIGANRRWNTGAISFGQLW